MSGVDLDPYKPPSTRSAEQESGESVNFSFSVGDHVITAIGEIGNGKEVVLVDGNVVFEGRSFSKSRSIDIEIGDEKYLLNIIVKSYFSNSVRCSLEKDGIEIDAMECTVKAGMISSVAFFIFVVCYTQVVLVLVDSFVVFLPIKIMFWILSIVPIVLVTITYSKKAKKVYKRLSN